MAKSQLKTKPTKVTPEEFVGKIAEEQVRDDCYDLIKMMQNVSGKPPVMWGPSIIGFDAYHYKYASGHEGDMCRLGFSPRKGNFALYVLGDDPKLSTLLKKLGKHKASKGCLYVKKLADVDMKVLEEIARRAIERNRKQYP